MDQGPLLPPLPLPHEYAISEQDCLDHFSGSHTPRTVFPPLELQRDNSLHQPGDPTFTFTGAGAGRFLADPGVSHHNSRNGSHQHLDDPEHLSASAGPNPGISTASIGNYSSQNRFSSFGAFNVPETLPYIHNTGSYATSRHPSESDSVASGMPLQPHPNFRPTHLLDGVPGGYRDQQGAQYTTHTLRSQLQQNQYGHVLDTTPRAVHFAPQPSPAQHYPAMPHAPSTTHRGAAHDTPASQFPWPNLEVLGDIRCQGQLVTPEVKAKVEKGFFVALSDNKWTCYRRNYFSVTCSYEMAPYIAGVPLQLNRNGKSDNILAMGVRMSAAVDGSGGKAIELVQHTPKRDNGPKTKIDIVKLYPAQPSARSDHGIGSGAMYATAFQHNSAAGPGGPHGPFMALQHLPDPTPEGGVAPAPTSTTYNYHSGSHATPAGYNTSHTFERVQFKQATANNGKRRASQQYFHLMIEVFADVRAEGDDEAEWVKVAQRVSDKVVVRGRSPSHYQCEGGQSNAAPRGGGGGGGRGGSHYTHHPGASYQSAGPPTYPMAGGYKQGYGLSHGADHNTGRAYKMSPSDDSSERAESVEGGMLDDGHPMDDRAMANIDRADHQQYHYYPSEANERSTSTSSGAYGGPQLLPIPKVEAGLRYATEPRYYQNTAKFDHHADSVIGTPLWESGASGPPSKFDGFTTSSGWFPPGSAGPHPGFL